MNTSPRHGPPHAPESARRSALIGSSLVAGGSIAFGFMGLFRTWAVESGASTETMLLLRFGVGGVLLAAIALVRTAHRQRAARASGRDSPPPPGWPRGRTLCAFVFMGAGLYVGETACYFFALEFIPTGLTSLLLYTYPAFVALLARVWLRQALTRPRMIGLTLALVGAGLTVGADGFDALGRGAWKGIALALASALFYGLYMLAGARFSPGVDPIAGAAVVCLAAAAMYALVAVARPPRFPLETLGWLGVLALGVVSTVIAISAILAGLARLGPVRASTLSTLEALTAVIVGAALLHEPLGPARALGGVLILAAAVLVVRERPEPGSR